MFRMRHGMCAREHGTLCSLHPPQALVLPAQETVARQSRVRGQVNRCLALLAPPSGHDDIGATAAARLNMYRYSQTGVGFGLGRRNAHNACGLHAILS